MSETAKKKNVNGTTGTKAPAKKAPQKTNEKKTTQPKAKPEIIKAKQHPVRDALKQVGATAKEFGKAVGRAGKAVVKSKPVKVAGVTGLLLVGGTFVKNLLSGNDEDEVFEGTETPVYLDDTNDDRSYDEEMTAPEE